MGDRPYALLALALLLALPLSAGADWVRDEIRVNMRTGPGLQFRILKVLVSGDRVQRIGTSSDWVHVRTSEGKDGWVPDGYVVREQPASIRLPAAETKLAEAEAKISALDSQLTEQTQAITELDELRAGNERLTTENIQLSGSSWWKVLVAGATTVLVGMVIGALVPRGGSQRARRIKL